MYIDPEILKQQNPSDEAPLQHPDEQTPVTQNYSPPEPVPTNNLQQAAPDAGSLQEQKQPSPTASNQEVFGSKKQMQNDLQYTSAMKKHKDMGKDEAVNKVESISARSNNVLMKIKAVFPFDFFPNTITIDANKITIVDKTFFASESVISILLEEITDVTVESNFFLGRIIITYSHHPLKPETYAIPSLRKKEALRAKDIIQGLLVLRISEGIDLSKLKPDEITKQLENIGKTHENLPSL